MKHRETCVERVSHDIYIRQHWDCPWAPHAMNLEEGQAREVMLDLLDQGWPRRNLAWKKFVIRKTYTTMAGPEDAPDEKEELWDI